MVETLSDSAVIVYQTHKVWYLPVPTCLFCVLVKYWVETLFEE